MFPMNQNAQDLMMSAPSETQNNSKAEHVPKFCGAGAAKATQDYASAMSAESAGKVLPTARYLGNWPTYNGGTRANTDRRYQAMQDGYYMFEKVWRDHSFPLRFKIMAFKNLIYKFIELWIHLSEFSQGRQGIIRLINSYNL